MRQIASMVLAIALLGAMQLGYAQVMRQGESLPSAELYQAWYSSANPNAKSTLPSPEFERLTDEEANLGIGCLLALEGNHGVGKFSGATRFEVSQTFPQASVELDALFLVSAIYSRRWNHADGIALADSKGHILNARAGAKRAFPSVKEWYSRVQARGIEEARSQHEDPLKGSGLHWY